MIIIVAPRHRVDVNSAAGWAQRITPLLVAAEHGRLDTIRAMLATGDDLIIVCDGQSEVRLVIQSSDTT